MTESTNSADGHGHPDHGHEKSHRHEHGDHAHGHQHDRGIRGFLRYLRRTRRMWRNTVNDHVVDAIDPQPGMVILDIGAGTGAGVMPAAKRGATVVAVDPTPYMRRVMTLRRLGQRNRTLITIADGAAEALPAADASVDVVWAVNTMHHWQDIEAAAGEIRRVLRPGGQTLLIDEDFEHPDHEFNVKAAKKGEKSGPKHRHALPPVGAKEMAAALQEAGLADVEAVDFLITPSLPAKQATGTKPGPD